MQTQDFHPTRLSSEVVPGCTLRCILSVASGGTRPKFAHHCGRLVGIVIATIWCSFLVAPAVTGDKANALNIDWNNSSGISKTDITLQVVENQKLRRGSDIHDRAWAALRDLNANYVRFALWFPYPRLAVAELSPPENGKTGWNFSLMDPLVEDFFKAASGHPVVMTVSTIPQWMFNTAQSVAIVDDPDQVVWNYEQGTELRDATMKEAADYFARVAGWYTKGGFTDEAGTFHESPYHYKIDYWEVLNEPEYEHQLGEKAYARLYDAVVQPSAPCRPKQNSWECRWQSLTKILNSSNIS